MGILYGGELFGVRSGPKAGQHRRQRGQGLKVRGARSLHEERLIRGCRGWRQSGQMTGMDACRRLLSDRHLCAVLCDLQLFAIRLLTDSFTAICPTQCITPPFQAPRQYQQSPSSTHPSRFPHPDNTTPSLPQHRTAPTNTLIHILGSDLDPFPHIPVEPPAGVDAYIVRGTQRPPTAAAGVVHAAPANPRSCRTPR